MKIGEKLKQGRLKKELTQEKVASILNISRQTVSSWELEKSYPDLENLVSLSDLYNISLDTLLREDTEMVKKITNDSKIVSYLVNKGRLIVLILLIIIISIGSMVYININKNLHIGVYTSGSNYYGIEVKGIKKYYDINESDLEIKNDYKKIIELNNFNNKVSIYNNSKNKIFDIKIIDNKNNKVIKQIESVYPNTSWEIDEKLDSSDYNILLKSSEYK